MTSQYFTWDTSWTATSIASSAIINTGSATTSAAIDNQSKFSTIVSITAVYGSGTLNQGIVVYILEDIDGTNFETTSDNPYAIQLAYASGGTYHDTIKVLGSMTRKFKVAITNNSGVTATCTVDYLQSTVTEA